MPRSALRLLVVALLVLPSTQALAAPLRVIVPPQTVARADAPDDQAWAMLRVVTPGTRVVVGRAMGAVAGTFVAVDSESITLRDAGYEGPRVVIPRREVTTVLGPPHRRVGPHLARGAAIGGAVGLLFGLYVVSQLEGDSEPGSVVLIAAFGAGIGLGAGAVAGLGADRTSDVLYRRPGNSTR